MRKYCRLNTSDLERMFPRLKDLIKIHLHFLHNLRKRQSEKSVVDTIADILVEQFSDEKAHSIKSVYGEFCSKHRDAVDAYKYFERNDPRFAHFVRLCQVIIYLKNKIV